MAGEVFEVDDVFASLRQPLEQPRFAHAGQAGEHVEPSGGAERFHLGDHMPPKSLPPALQDGRLPSDLAENQGKTSGPLAAAPAVQQRAPVPRLGGAPGAEVDRDVGRDGGGAEPAGGKAVPRIECAHFGAFGVTEHGQVDRAWHVVVGEFRR